MRQMNELKVAVVPCSATPLLFDGETCISCNACANICQWDVLPPSAEAGTHPVMM